MSALPPPAWLRSFETAARLGGFAAAAAALGLTPAAVSQQIRALEARLGFALFRRLPRGVELSEMGRAYLPSVRRAFEDLETATVGLFGVGQARAVTIRTPISFATLRLAPALPAFRQRHPEVPLRLCTAVWADGLDEDSIDIDIRYGGGDWPGAEVERLTDPVSVPVLPPGMADHPALADAVQRMARDHAIHVTGYESLWSELARAQGWDLPDIRAGVSADSSLAALEMVAAGMGCAIIARDLARPHIDSGRVCAAPALALRHGHAHHLVRPIRARAERPETLLFRTWLRHRFGVADRGARPQV